MNGKLLIGGQMQGGSHEDISDLLKVHNSSEMMTSIGNQSPLWQTASEMNPFIKLIHFPLWLRDQKFWTFREPYQVEI